MSNRERDAVHLIAGGIAGTTGAIATCPLEVVKTRLQSSSASIGSSLRSTASVKQVGNEARQYLRIARNGGDFPNQHLVERPSKILCRPRQPLLSVPQCGLSTAIPKVSIVQCLKHIVQTEGPRALFKGLGPNIVGVAPSRAIYFCTYSKAKNALNSIGLISANSPLIHILSASSAGFVSCTLTNPIWFVKTRMQLDYNASGRQTVLDFVQRIYKDQGIRGFYKGITASYVGISETVIQFVIYEALKKKLNEQRHHGATGGNTKTSRDFLEFMAAGATAKTVASVLTYPHEVARTRLREEGNKYRSFWQTIVTVAREEGRAGLYRGLGTQMVRQIPNTAIMMATYEAVVYVLSK